MAGPAGRHHADADAGGQQGCNQGSLIAAAGLTDHPRVLHSAKVFDQGRMALRGIVIHPRLAAGGEGIERGFGNIQADEVDRGTGQLFLAMRVHDSISGSRFDRERNR